MNNDDERTSPIECTKWNAWKLKAKKIAENVVKWWKHTHMAHTEIHEISWSLFEMLYAAN